MKTDVNDLQKVPNKQKTLKRNFFFVGILSATDEIPSGLLNIESGSRSREQGGQVITDRWIRVHHNDQNMRLSKSVNVHLRIFCYLA